MGDTTCKLPRVSSVLRTCCNEVRYCAATWEYCVGNSGITAIDDDRQSDNRIGAVVICVYYTVAVSVMRDQAEVIDGKGRPGACGEYPKMESCYWVPSSLQLHSSIGGHQSRVNQNPKSIAGFYAFGRRWIPEKNVDLDSSRRWKRDDQGMDLRCTRNQLGNPVRNQEARAVVDIRKDSAVIDVVEGKEAEGEISERCCAGGTNVSFGAVQVPTAPSATLSKSNGTALALLVTIVRTAKSKT